MKVAEERSTSNAVARGGQGGREQAQAEGQLAEVGGMIKQLLSGAFPRENTTRCASVVAAGL